MCFGAVGDAIGDVFHSVDTVANSINPFKGITDWGTKNTLGKIPGVGKPLGQLADWGDSHPAEVGAAIGAGWGAAAYLGAGAAGAAGEAGTLGAGASAAAGGAGAAGAAAGAGAAGAVGEAASATGGVSATTAAEGAGAAGAVGAASGASSAGGSAAAATPAATNPWLSGAATAAKYVAPAVVSSLLQPKPPKTKAPTAMPDPLAQQQAAQQKVIAQIARRGRSSTILTNPGNSGGALGG